jgi:hypothetical protein
MTNMTNSDKFSLFKFKNYLKFFLIIIIKIVIYLKHQTSQCKKGKGIMGHTGPEQ